MSNPDPSNELDMIRSLLEAEQTKNTGQLQEVHTKILNKLSASETEASSTDGKENTSGINGISSRGEHIMNSANKHQAKSTASGTSSRISSLKRGGSAYGGVRTSGDRALNSISRLLRQRRQKNPVIVMDSTKVEELSRTLCKQRQNAALIRSSSNGKICGILTDADICRRLVAQGKDARTTSVMEIMTPNPQFVNPAAEVLEVFGIMVANRFRHLPVLDRDGETVYGLVDITQCLYDAINRIEKMQKSQVEFVRSVQRAHVRWSSSINDDPGGTAVLAQQMIEHMMEKIAPTINSILASGEKELLTISSDSTVLKAAELMGKHKQTAVLGVADARAGDRLSLESDFGIFTTKDLLSKVIAKGLDPSNVKLDEVMTRRPDTVEDSSSLLDALHIMHDGRFLHVPVTSELYGESGPIVCGVLDVLDCAVHTFSRVNDNHPSSGDQSSTFNASDSGDREIFSKLFLEHGLGYGQDADNVSTISDNMVSNSARSHGSADVVGMQDSVSQHGYDPSATSHSTVGSPTIAVKIKTLMDGKIHRVTLSADTNWNTLKNRMVSMTGLSHLGDDAITFSYVDEEGDPVTLASDSALHEARMMCQAQNLKKFTVLISRSKGHRTVKKEGKTDALQNMDSKVIGIAFASGIILCLGLLLLSSGPNHSRGRHRYR